MEGWLPHIATLIHDRDRRYLYHRWDWRALDVILAESFVEATVFSALTPFGYYGYHHYLYDDPGRSMTIQVECLETLKLLDPSNKTCCKDLIDEAYDWYSQVAKQYE